MKQKVINEVMQGMLGCLNNVQLERLQEVLEHALFHKGLELLILLFPCAGWLSAYSIFAHESTDARKAVVPTYIGIVLAASISLSFSVLLIERSVKRNP